MTKPKYPQEDPAQSKRFRDLAKKLEADGTAADLEKAVKTLAPQKRSPEVAKKGK